MELLLVSMSGRLLIIPVALSGICLSMLFGVPMTQAMDSKMFSIRVDVPIEHEMGAIQYQDSETQPGCCATVRMQHDTDATVPDQDAFFVSFTTDLPNEIPTRHIGYAEEKTSSSDYHPPHRPFSLTGTTIKRE